MAASLEKEPARLKKIQLWDFPGEGGVKEIHGLSKRKGGRVFVRKAAYGYTRRHNDSSRTHQLSPLALGCPGKIIMQLGISGNIVEILPSLLIRRA